MMSNLPIHIAASGAHSSVAAAEAGGGQQLPVGELLLATVSGAVPNGSPDMLRLVLGDGTETFIRTSAPLQTGEGVVVQARGEGDAQTLQVLARSGQSGGSLKVLNPGQIRLAQNQALTDALRAILANGKETIQGRVLPFRHSGSAPVQIGPLTVNFQLDSGARPGDQLFLQPLEAGGALGLNVFARGGPKSVGLPSGGSSLADVLGVRVPASPSLSPDGLPAPGSVLTGTVVRISGEVSTSPNAPFSKLEGHSSQVDSRQGLAGARNSSARSPVPPGSPIRPGGQTALFRFAGFDVEVPLPAQAVSTLSSGSSVQVLVNQVSPTLDLTLLPLGGEVGRTAFVPSGEVGAAGFGANIMALAEGLAGPAADARGVISEEQVQQAFDGLRQVLDSVVLRGDALTPSRIRQAIQGSGASHLLDGLQMGATGEAPRDLKEGIQQFLSQVRLAGGRESQPLAELMGQMEQSLTSVEFLQTVNGLRQLLDQGTYFQIPYALGAEQGTMDIIVRPDGEERGDSGEKENHSAVFLLELEGLGSLRIDAGVQSNRVNIRFTTPDEQVGRFIEKELPNLRESLEAQEMGIDGLSWIQSRVVPEPVVPADNEKNSTDGSYISLRV